VQHCPFIEHWSHAGAQPPPVLDEAIDELDAAVTPLALALEAPPPEPLPAPVVEALAVAPPAPPLVVLLPVVLLPVVLLPVVLLPVVLLPVVALAASLPPLPFVGPLVNVTSAELQAATPIASERPRTVVIRVAVRIEQSYHRQKGPGLAFTCERASGCRGVALLSVPPGRVLSIGAWHWSSGGRRGSQSGSQGPSHTASIVPLGRKKRSICSFPLAVLRTPSCAGVSSTEGCARSPGSGEIPKSNSTSALPS